MKKDGERMNQEKNVMKCSLVASGLFVVLECILSLYIHSNTIFIDFVYGCFDLLMMYPFLALIPYLYKPVSEKHPYGYAQVESLFVLVKYLLLMIIVIQLVISNIRDILHGGHEINVGWVMICEFVLGIYVLGCFLFLRWISRNCRTSIIKAELYMWKIDLIGVSGIIFSFFIQWVLKSTALAWFVCYMDSLVAIVLSVIFLREPLQNIFLSVRELILFAPKENVMTSIREVVEKDVSRYNYYVSFLDVIQTGRKVWIDVYVGHQEDVVSVKDLRHISAEISSDLKDDFDQLYVELIPELTEAI